MNIKKLLVDGVAVFVVALVVSVAVSLLWNLVVHGTRALDWESSFRFAVLFGIIVPWLETRKRPAK